MPSNWLYVDTNFPNFTGEEQTEEKIDVIQNYLFMLVEQLRYSLRNLDLRNVNQTVLQQYTESVSEPLEEQIEQEKQNTAEVTDGLSLRLSDAEGHLTELDVRATGIEARLSDAEGNLTQLGVYADGIEARVSDAEGHLTQLDVRANGIETSVSDAEGHISEVKQFADEIKASVQNAEGDIATLTERAGSIETSVENAMGEISQVRQYAESITLSVENGEESSVLKLTAGETVLSSAEIVMNGIVTFVHGLEDGTTIIDGGCIQTGEIDGKYIKAGTIAADRVVLTGSIQFEDFSSALQTSWSYCVNPSYIKSTYIDHARIESPTIVADEFCIYGNFGSILDKVMFRVSYFDSIGAPYINLDSDIGGTLRISYSNVEFNSVVHFEDMVYFNSGVSGINALTLVPVAEAAAAGGRAASPGMSEGPGTGESEETEEGQNVELRDAGGVLEVRVGATVWMLDEEGWRKKE